MSSSRLTNTTAKNKLPAEHRTAPYPDFEMNVGLGVLESLGINLYSNAAAVLTEVVANAWDADANRISIEWDKAAGRVTIEDDGSGMAFDDLNRKFLTVGYQKRDTDGLTSPKFGRPYMGRKGIGKLAIFSLANEVDIISRRQDGAIEALHIGLPALRAAISSQKTYNPPRIDPPGEFPAQGTRLVLTDLNMKRAGITLTALRRRIARRFDVLSFEPSDGRSFRIEINGEAIGYEDREDLKRIEYLWTFGPNPFSPRDTPNLKKHWTLGRDVDPIRGWSLGGWFGTVKTPRDLQLEGDGEESLRNMMIIARRRPIQEGILDQLHFNKLFGSYVTGQIVAEFLDVDEMVDIATSDRQRLMEDDERVVLLRKVLRERLLEAESSWSVERPKQKFKDLTSAYPEVHNWVESRPGTQHHAAKKLIETIASITLDSEASRRELFRAGILGFERIALDATTDDLGKFATDITADDILPLLTTQRTYEDALYGQILRSRIAAIEQLERLIDEDQKERALQQHLFDNMWLLDPSWEHATADASMEVSLRRIRGDLFDPGESEKQSQGRIDIKYRAAAGIHMVVELKRFGYRSHLNDLREQGGKYWEALVEVLTRNGTPSQQVAVVFVLGHEPRVGVLGNQTIEDRIAADLAGINGRVLYYETLLNNAKRQYAVYAESLSGNSDLSKVLASLSESAQIVEVPESAGWSMQTELFDMNAEQLPSTRI